MRSILLLFLTALCAWSADGLGPVPSPAATTSASSLTSGTLPDGRFPVTLPAISGVNLTALNATNLGSGTVPDARFPATLPAASGVNLTALNATNLGSGTVPDARFPATLPAASGVNLTAINATNLGSGTVPDARFPATLPAASGVNLTAINATNLGSGTVPDARFPATLPAASGVNLTALNATNLASGAVPAARMPAFTGDVTTSAGSIATTLTIDWNSHVRSYSDFMGNALAEFSANNSGTGSGVSVSNVIDPNGHPGIANATTGTTTTGRAAVAGSGTSPSLGFGVVTWEADVQLPTASDGTDTYTSYNGIMDLNTGDSVDGLYFRYTHSVNSGKWECVTRSNSVEVAYDSATTMTAASWYKLTIIVNAAASQADFYINGSLVKSATTGAGASIPTGTARSTGIGCNILKSAGTTARLLYIDYMGIDIRLTTPR